MGVDVFGRPGSARRYISILGGLLLAFAGAGASSQPIAQPKPSRPAEASAAAPGSSAAPLVVRVLPAPKSAAELELEQIERRRRSDIERKALFTNVVLALIGAGQLIVTLVTLRGLRHARLAAEAAKDSVTLAADTAKRQLRAYLAVPNMQTGVAFASTVEGVFGNFVVAWADVANVGQTPAHDAVVNITWQHGNDLDSVVWNADEGVMPAMIGAGPPVQSSRIYIPEDLVRRADGRELRIFVRVATSYRDIFNDAHRTVAILELILHVRADLLFSAQRVPQPMSMAVLSITAD